MKFRIYAVALLALLVVLAGCQSGSALSEPPVSEISSRSEASVSVPERTQRTVEGVVHISEEPGQFTIETEEGLLTFSDRQLPSGTVHEGAVAQVTYWFSEDDKAALEAVSLTEIQKAPMWAEYFSEADRILEQMTLEQKVGQIFFIRCADTSEQAVEDIKNWNPGGVLLFARDFQNKNAQQVIDTISAYQEASALPLLIGADEEGGTVVRVSANPLLREERFQAPGELYRSGGLEALTADAQEKSRLLLSLGVNVNLAPVCDVSSDPSDYIYPRALGEDAQTTASYVSAVTAVMKQEGIGCVLKHFPGYGSNRDTHTGIAYDTRPYQQFLEEDFLPFQAGIEAGAGCVLVSHNIVESMDRERPASLSPRVHEILRETLGFEGVILTDDLMMDAIGQYTDGASAAVQAVQAGNDMLIVTDYSSQIPAVISAVRDGTLDEAQIDAAARQVLCWKLSLGLLADGRSE